METKQKRKYTKRNLAKTSAGPAAESVKRPYTIAPRAVDPGVPCVHCGHRYGHVIVNTYPNGNRRRVCGGCGNPFCTTRIQENREIAKS